MDAAERLEDDQSGVLDEVLQTGHQEEIIIQHLQQDNQEQEHVW